MTYPPPPDQPQYGPPLQGEPQWHPQYGPPPQPQPQYGPPQGQPYPQAPPAYGYPAPAKRRRVSQPVVGWLLLVSGFLLLGAGPMTWASVPGYSVAGTVGGGKVTAFFGVVILVFGLLIGLRQGMLWVSITSCVLAALVVLIALGNIGSLKSVARDHSVETLGVTVSIGAGLWLTLLAGLAALTLSIIAIARRPVHTS